MARDSFINQFRTSSQHIFRYFEHISMRMQASKWQ